MPPTDDPQASHVHVSARAIGALLRALEVQALPVGALLESAEILPATLADPGARIAYEKLLRLWVAAVRESGDEFLGLHSAARVRLVDFEILGYLASTCPTVGELLMGFQRYQRLLADAIEITPSFEPGGIRIRHTVPMGYRLPRPVAEYVMGVMVVLLRAALAEHVVPREVCFSHAEPTTTAAYSELFGCPILFDAPEESILLDLDLARPIATADGELHRILRRQADQLVQQAGQDDLVVRVSRIVEEKLLRGGFGNGGGSEELLDPDSVARALGVSQRSLRRRLGERGTSLTEVADALRREVAMHHLASSALSIGEIGFLLGFSEPSAFHRAFKRWTSQTPAEFRLAGRPGSTPS